jgi:hypothetical protein
MTRNSRTRQEERKGVIEIKGEKQVRRKLVNYQRRKVVCAVYKSACGTNFSRKTAIPDHMLRLETHLYLQIMEYTGLLPELNMGPSVDVTNTNDKMSQNNFNGT